MNWSRRFRLWLRFRFRKGVRVLDRWLTPLPEPRRTEMTWRDSERARAVRGRLRRGLRGES
jgi:hypothetical protein